MSLSPKLSSSPAPEQDIYGTSPAPPTRRALNNVRERQQQSRQQSQQTVLSPSPTASNSSDKENASIRAASSNKGKGRAVMVSEEDRHGKRRRNTELEANPRPSHRPRVSTEAEDQEERREERAYDPDQNPAELRQNKRDLRDIASLMNDNYGALTTTDTMGAYNIIKKANKILPNIKQTSVATIDSRLMVTASLLSYRQTCQLSLGNTVQGIDIDEFVSKCITFMKSGPESDDSPQTQPSSTQTQSRQRRRTNADVDEEDDEDNGNGLNWAHLGQMACHQYNSRPAVPGFLLGPLSLEKKARKAVQRTARLKLSQYTQTQPQILEKGDRDHDKTKTLPYLTKMIHTRLIESRKERLNKVEAIKKRNPNMSMSEAKQLMEANGLLFPHGGINMWQFVVNPKSFGQTVENIFYVSFLIRDGKARLAPDDDGQLGLFPEEPRGNEEQRGSQSTKYQGIISIDMAEYHELIELYDIKESVIQHRNEGIELAVRSWV